MPSQPALPAQARRLLELARTSKERAAGEVAAMPLEAQVALVCEAPLSARGALLDLLPEPDLVIPALPEAELCYTVKAIGLEDASWVLGYARPEQIVACVDLDAWGHLVPSPSVLGEWLDALLEMNDDALLRSLRALDPEMLTLYLKSRLEAIAKPDDDEGWQPPEGAQTLEGQFYLRARLDGDDLATPIRLLRLLFEKDYWFYFRMVQAIGWELETENQEWALRWRTGRLQDLGFPAWERAIEIYAYVKPEARVAIPVDDHPLDVEEWHLPVWLPNLPGTAESGHLVFHAGAALEVEERRRFFYAFISIANKVAVADGMPLGDPESIPNAIEKAAKLASGGLEFLSKENSVEPVEVLRRASLERLFRIGANLDPQAARPSL